ncbi:hypothetical protein [Amphritea sp.]|uniref:hypothetical protein n=1 Tax=Amphritea sp. TaxID=1872502 RepID=UPI0025BE985A|nr:hypothetical protein [Amphritea sp.]
MNKLYVYFLTIAVFLPTSFSFALGSLRLSSYRVVCIFIFIVFFSKILKTFRGGFFSPQVLICLYVFWVFLAITVNHGVGYAIEAAGVHFLETFVPFIAIFMYCSSTKNIYKYVRFIILLLLLMLLVTIPETLTGFNWFRTLTDALTGGYHSHIDKRMGLTRSLGTFDHAILLGVISASMISMAFFVYSFKKAVVISLCAALSLSSGAMASISFQWILITWSKVFKRNSKKWMMFFILFLVIYISIDVLSNRTPLKVMLHYLTFSAHTAYWRILIFEYGIQNAISNPFFGIGYNDWVRPSWMLSGSMDNFWLVNMVRYGFPSFILYAGSVLSILVSLFRLKVEDPDLLKLRRGWLAGMAGLIVSASTVHLWNNAYVFFNMYLGLGLALLYQCKRSSGINK